MIYVCGKKPMKLGTHNVTENVELVDAATWNHLQSWIRAGRVKMICPGDTYTTWAAFIAGGG